MRPITACFWFLLFVCTASLFVAVYLLLRIPSDKEMAGCFFGVALVLGYLTIAFAYEIEKDK